MFKRKKNNKGFTLVELLVVIAIIGILAVVAVPSLMKNIDKAKAADIVADYSTIKSVVMSQYTDGSLEDGTYIKAKGSSGKMINGENSLDVEDLSKQVAYTLEVSDGAKTAELTIKAENNKIAKEVNDKLELGTLEDNSDTISDIKILK